MRNRRHECPMVYWECTECGTVSRGEWQLIRRQAPAECDNCGEHAFTRLEPEETDLPAFNLDTFVKLTLMIVTINLIGMNIGLFLGASGSRIILSMAVTIPVIGGIGYGVSRRSKIAWVAGTVIFAGTVLFGFLLLAQAFALLSAGVTPFPTFVQIVFGISYVTLGTAALWMLVAGWNEIWQTERSISSP